MCQMAIFMFLYFLKSRFYALYNGENHYQIRELMAKLYVFEYGLNMVVRHTTLSRKLALDIEDFYVKTFLGYHEPW